MSKSIQKSGENNQASNSGNNLPETTTINPGGELPARTDEIDSPPIVSRKPLIGLVLFFDGPGFSRNKSMYQNTIIPAWEKIVEAYNELGIGEFDQEVYTEITTNGLRGIKEKYVKAVKTELQKLNSPLLSKKLMQIEEGKSAFRRIEIAWDNFLNTITREQGKYYEVIADHAFLSWDAENSDFKVNNDLMEKSFQEVIATDKQAAAYEAVLDFKAAHENLKKALAECLPKDAGTVPLMPGRSDEDGAQLVFESFGEFEIDNRYFASIFK